MKKCNSCGFENDNKSMFCEKCGAELPSSAKLYCSHCGREIESENSFCNYCGTKAVVPEEPVLNTAVKEAEQESKRKSNVNKSEKKPDSQKSKTAVVVVLIAVIVLALGAAGFFIYQNIGGKAAITIGGSKEDKKEEAPETTSLVPEEAFEFNGHYYMLVDESMLWSEAKLAAEERGGHLVTITSQEEEDFVESIVDSYATKKHYWLGGTDEKEEGTWTWVTGEAWNYHNFYWNQPNNKSDVDPVHGQDYLEMQAVIGEKGIEGYMSWADTVDSGISYGYEGAPEYDTTEYFGYIIEWEHK